MQLVSPEAQLQYGAHADWKHELPAVHAAVPVHAPPGGVAPALKQAQIPELSYSQFCVPAQPHSGDGLQALPFVGSTQQVPFWQTLLAQTVPQPPQFSGSVEKLAHVSVPGQ